MKEEEEEDEEGEEEKEKEKEEEEAAEAGYSVSHVSCLVCERKKPAGLLSPSLNAQRFNRSLLEERQSVCAYVCVSLSLSLCLSLLLSYLFPSSLSPSPLFPLAITPIIDSNITGCQITCKITHADVIHIINC